MWNYANFVKSFQTRLSKYDKQTVEQSLEQKILHDMDEANISENNFKPFLLDVDLVRGSVFSKKKPRQGWALTIIRGFLRSMFAPFYWSYWCQHTSRRLAAFIMLHFSVQFLQVLCFLLLDSETSLRYQDDLIVPCLLAVCLGILHTHIVAVHGGGGAASSNTVGDLGRRLLNGRGAITGGSRFTAVNPLGPDGYSYDARRRESGVVGNADSLSGYDLQPPSSSQLHPRKVTIGQKQQQQHLCSKLHSGHEDGEEEADIEEEDDEDEGLDYPQQSIRLEAATAGRTRRAALQTGYSRSLLGGDDDLPPGKVGQPSVRSYRQDGDRLFGKIARPAPRRSEDADQRQMSPSPFSQYDPTSCGVVRRRYAHHRGSHRHGHEADFEDSEADNGSQLASDEPAQDSPATTSSRPVVDLFPSASLITTTSSNTGSVSTGSQQSSTVSTVTVCSAVGGQGTAIVPAHATLDSYQIPPDFTDTKPPSTAHSRLIGPAPTDWPLSTTQSATVDSSSLVRSRSIHLPVYCNRLQLSTACITPTYCSCLLASRQSGYSSSATNAGSSCALNHQLMLLAPTVGCQLSADPASRSGPSGGKWFSEPNLVSLPGAYQLPVAMEMTSLVSGFRSHSSSSSSSSLRSRATMCIPMECRTVPAEDRRNLIEPIEVDDIRANPKSLSQQSANRIPANRKVFTCQTNGPPSSRLVSDPLSPPFISRSLNNLSWTADRSLASATVTTLAPACEVLAANPALDGEATGAQQFQIGTNGTTVAEVSGLNSLANEDTVTVNNRRLTRYLHLFRQRLGTRALLPPPAAAALGFGQQLRPGHRAVRHRLSRSTCRLADPGGVTSQVGATVAARTLCVEPISRHSPRVVAGLCPGNGINSCGSNGSAGGGYHKESALTEHRRGSYLRRSSKRRYLRTSNNMRFCNHVKLGDSKTSTMNNRGQTASETEYERINSDIGSEIDSSSGPDEQPTSGHSTRSIIPPPAAQKHQQSIATRVAVHSPQLSDEPLTSTANFPVPKPQQRTRPVVSTSSSSSSIVRLQTTVDTDAGAFDVDLDIDGLCQPRSDDNSSPFRQLADVSLSNAAAAVADESSTTAAPMTVETLGGDLRSGADEYPHRNYHQQSAPPAAPSAVNLCPNVEAATTNEQPPFDPIAVRYRYEHRSESLVSQWGQLPFANTDSVRCYVWEGGRMCKLNLSMFDIGWNVVRAVERQGVSSDYVIIGCIASLLLSLLSVVFHWEPLSVLFPASDNSSLPADNTTPNLADSSSSSNLLGLQVAALVQLLQVTASALVGRPARVLARLVAGLVRTGPVDWCQAGWSVLSGRWLFAWLSAAELPSRMVVLLGIPIRFCVYGVVFLLLSIAEQTFQQRLLYAKYFFSLTSSRRARKYRLPHFRLNKLRHIKCWLTLRSYLKRRGPQRSVEHIIAAAFYMLFVLGLVMCSQLISRKEGTFFTQITNWDIVCLTVAVTIYLHRLIIIGTKITKQYRNFSVIITEQINLYLCLEKKPHKKEELMSTFQVLRLVEGLIKEVDGPFRVCGWTVNPLVYNIFKLVLLSCFSSLLSQTFGFKLKLYKLKLNAANW